MRQQIVPNRTVPVELYEPNTGMFAHWEVVRREDTSVVLAVKPDIGKDKDSVFFPCLSELRRHFK